MADAVALARDDPQDPSTWKMAPTDMASLEQRILSGLRAKGYPATSVELDATKLKGGYICDTMRVFIAYTHNEQHSAKAEAQGRLVDGGELPKSVVSRPRTAILKIASPLSNDLGRRPSRRRRPSLSACSAPLLRRHAGLVPSSDRCALPCPLPCCWLSTYIPFPLFPFHRRRRS